MNYTYKQIWLINFPVMMSILMEQLINITDAIFLGHVGEVELGASALAGIYYLAVYMLGFGFSIGLQVMIARRNGEQHLQSPNQKIPDRKTKCVIKTHINIKQNVIFGAKLKPV